MEVGVQYIFRTEAPSRARAPRRRRAAGRSREAEAESDSSDYNLRTRIGTRTTTREEARALQRRVAEDSISTSRVCSIYILRVV